VNSHADATNGIITPRQNLRIVFLEVVVSGFSRTIVRGVRL
jgi:hypothetical protein